MTQRKSDVDSSSGSESTDSRKHSNKWKEKKEERKEKREQRKKEWDERAEQRKNEWDERTEQRKKEWDERKDQRKKDKEDKKKAKDHKPGHSDASPHHLMTQSEQPQFGAGTNVGGYHYPEHPQQYGHHAGHGGEHGGFHQQATPPPYAQQSPLPPPSGYRLPLTTQTLFPIDPNQIGPPAFIDADGISPIFVGSALMENSVHPCKIGPHLNPFASVPYGGGEFGHQGRFDLLPFRHDQMEWVRTSAGRIPGGRKPIEGGYEEDGNKLYHAVAIINGVNVPGKTGEHLGGARVPFGGMEYEIYDGYDILCWR